MPDRADAHIHLFEGAYQGGSLASRPGVRIDEAALYASFARDHRVARALVVGYEGEPWAKANNAYLMSVATQYAWVAPVAFVDPANPPDIDSLQRFGQAGFVGVSLYIFGGERVARLRAIPDDIWAWLARRRWLVSVNSRGQDWLEWVPILRRHPDLRVIAAHLGLPGRFARPPSEGEARQALAGVLALAEFPGARVKLSGFYAASDPPHGYPHPAAWPCVEVLKGAFGVARMLWGSDFSPSLDHVTFPQALDVIGEIPCLDPGDRARIEGENLLQLLAETSGRPAPALV